jgi:lysophospholipase L1-like esterase
MENIFILGDSISKGILFDNIKEKYTLYNDSFLNKLYRLYPQYVQSKTKFGATIQHAYKYLNEKLNILQSDYIVMEYGGNDCDFHWDAIANNPYEEHKPKTPLNEYSAIMEEIINKVISCGKKVILSTLPPIDSKKYFNFLTQNDEIKGDKILIWLKNIDNISRWQESYNNIIWKNAMKYNCLILDIRTPFLQSMNCSEYLCDDGIHPNEQGHNLIYNTIRNTFNI